MTITKNRTRLPEAIILIVLFLLPCLFFWRLLAPNPADRATIPAGDFTEQYYPLHLFAAREWAQGRLPLWDPHIYAGQPALADIQSGALYPLNLLVVLLLALVGRGFPLWALEAQVILHFSLASVFTYLFVRRLSRSRFAAAVSALTFTYSGYLTSFPVQQVTILQVAVWLPLILLLLDLAIGGRDPAPGRVPALGSQFWFYIILAGLAFGCAILAGHPQTAMHVFYASIAYFAFKVWRGPSPTPALRAPPPSPNPSTSLRASFGRGLVGILVFLLVAFGLAAVQLLPTLEFIGLSPRAAIDYETASWGLFWHETMSFLFPGYFGGSPQYVGILPMVLAAMAILFEGRQRDKVFWIGLGLIAFFLSLGRHTFLYNVFYVLVPGFGRVRNQERVIFLFSFSLAILAGYGATLLVRPIPRVLRHGFQSFYQVLKRLGLAGLALTAFFYYGWLQGVQEGADPNFFAATLRHHVFNLLLFGGVLLLLALRLRRGASRRWLMGLCVGIIAFNLFTINWQFNLQDATEEDHFPQMGVTDSLRAEFERGGPFRVSTAGLLPGAGNAGILYQLYDVAGNSPLHLASLEKFEAQVSERRRWQLLNVTYVFDLRDLDSEDLEFVYIKRGVRTYQVVDALPHAWAVHEAVVAAGDEETWAILNAPDFDPMRRVVLPNEPGIALPEEDTAGSRVDILEYTPTRVSLQVDMVDNGLIVLSDVHYPGWQARVDGQPAPIYRANYLLRAVPVEAGQHRIEVYYDPPLFKVGLAITILTLLASGALLGGMALMKRSTLLVLSIMLLIACSVGKTPQPTPTSSAVDMRLSTPTPTRVLTPTEMPVPTNTPQPTTTPVPPTATPVLSHTPTPLPTATPEPTSTTGQEGRQETKPAVTTADAQNVELIGHVGGAASAVFAQGPYAYVGVGPELAILDISDSTRSARVGYVVLPDMVRDVYVADGYAYVADDGAGLWVVDVSTPAAPAVVGFYDTPGYARGIAVAGGYAYVADDEGLRVVDVSDPAAPAEVGFYDTPGTADDVAVVGGYAYVGETWCHSAPHQSPVCEGSLRVVDVSDPAALAEVGLYDMPGYATDRGVAVAGDYAYVADGYGGLRVVDISDPTAPTEVSLYEEVAFDVAVAGNYAYVAAGESLQVIDVSNPTVPVKVGSYQGEAARVVVSGSCAYVIVSGGLRMVDVSDPTTPAQVGFYDTLGGIDDVVMSDSYTYLINEFAGFLQVVDVSDLTTLAQVGFYDTPREAKGVTVAGRYAYVADGDCAGGECDGNLWVVDVSDPTAPTEVGSYDPPGFAWGVTVFGGYAYVADRLDGLRVVDVSDPTAPIEIGFYDTPGFAMDVAVADSYAYVADREGGLRVVDVSDLAAPAEVGFYISPDEAWDVAVMGRYAYVATRSRGLRIVDVSDPAAPFEVGSCDLPANALNYGVAVAGNHAYLAAGFAGLRVVDVADPTVPVEIGFYDTPGVAQDVVVAGGYIYVADGLGGLVVLFVPSVATF